MSDLLIAAIAAFVLIFLIMMFLTRSLVAAFVIPGTVAFSYAGAFGLSILVWQHLIGLHLHWLVLPLTFIILVAVGSDYNLLLIGRVKEEIHAGLHTGLIRALGSTGGVVTSAGLVFAFTMLAMLTSDLRTIGQVGSTVCIGLLLDTLIVRSFVVPSSCAFSGRGSGGRRWCVVARSQGARSGVNRSHNTVAWLPPRGPARGTKGVAQHRPGQNTSAAGHTRLSGIRLSRPRALRCEDVQTTRRAAELHPEPRHSVPRPDRNEHTMTDDSVDVDRVRMRALMRHQATVVTISGDVDASNDYRVHDFATRFVAVSKALILDLSGVEFFSAAGLSVLIAVDEACRTADVEWALISSRVVNRVLRLIDCDTTLPTASSVPEALKQVNELT